MSKEGQKQKNGGIILLIILLILIVLSGGFLLLYSLLNNYKNLVNKEKNDTIVNIYELNGKSNLKEDKTRTINSYTTYEDDEFKILINKDKFVEIKNKKTRKTFIVEEVKNAKKFLYDNVYKTTMHILNDAGEVWYYQNNEGLANYANINESLDEFSKSQYYFNKIIQTRDGRWSIYEKYDEITFSDFYLVKEYSGYYELGMNYGFNSNINIRYNLVGLSTNNNFYEIFIDSFDELKPIKSLETYSDEKNKNIVGYIGDDNFGYMLDFNGELMLFRNSEFLSNKIKFQDDNKNKIYKMFVYFNQAEYDLYVITTDNKLYSTSINQYLTISDVIELEEVKEKQKIKTIEYTVPKKYKEKISVNENFKIKDLKFNFDDGSILIIDNINYDDTFNILESE